MDIGFYGKLPSHGDFLRRRVSTAFVDRWDAWLQACLASSQERLGGRWLDVYLTSPVWRFAAAAGACGPLPVMGVMVPSVDRVGRYFPLTLVAELPPDVNLIAVMTSAASFLASAEALLIETLETDRIDFDAFDAQVAALAPSLESGLPERLALAADAAAVLGDAAALWQLPMGGSEDVPVVFQQLAYRRLAAVHEPVVFWWTDGSSDVEPSCLVSKGLPEPSAFAALLDGHWRESPWQGVTATVDTGDTVEMAVDAVGPLAFRSAAASHVGLVRANNEDAFIERPEVGLWAVADGLGGHRDGEVASHMVCDAMAELNPLPTFDETLYAARERLQAVNEQLLRQAGAGALTERSASTVVLLLARGSTCAVLWAGDSRVYRYRAGVLEEMSRDHTAAEDATADGEPRTNTITRAVGVHPTLPLDLLRDRIRPGDRFLLCSDGLTRLVPEAQIEKWLQTAELEEAVGGLIRETLAAGAPDNVTVIIVEAFVTEPEPGAL